MTLVYIYIYITSVNLFLGRKKEGGKERVRENPYKVEKRKMISLQYSQQWFISFP